MEITLAIRYIYPTLTDDDFMVFNDNQGEPDYIKWYNTEITQPTQAELEAAWAEVVKEQDLITLKQEKKEAIEKVASISDQLNLTAGTLDIVVDVLAETNPEILTHPWIIESKEKLEGIKNILNN